MGSNKTRTLIINLAGFLAVLLSFYYVFNVLKGSELRSTSLQLDLKTVVLFILCPFFYGVSQFLLSETWRKLLESFGAEPVDRMQCHKLYGQTQITKYIPGNIFHFVGRQIRGRELGFSHTVLAGATLFESLGLVIVASIISILGSLIFGLNHENLSLLSLGGIVVVSLTVIVGFVFYLPKLSVSSGIGKIQEKTGTIFRILKTVIVFYSIYFLISGSVLFALVDNFSDAIIFSDFGLVFVVCVFSWIVGFITPGAPAGIGVREALIILLLTHLVGGAVSVISALSYRVITVIGDIVFYLLARAIRAPGTK